jgi:hypothetical protein
MKNILVLICLFCIKGSIFAQDLGTWNILNIKYGLNEKWTLFGESQIRSLKFYDHFHYYENKMGIEYKIHPEFRLAIAIGDYDTYASGGTFVNPKNNDEFRIWPQLLFTHKVGKIKLEQRYRAEMRFTLNGYRNRFRYKVGISYPFGKSEKVKDRFEIGISNELFFTDKAAYFERNRLQFFFNLKLNESVSTMLGYLHQFDYQINDETGRDFLQLGLSFRLKRK